MNSVYLSFPTLGTKQAIQKAFGIGYQLRGNQLFTGKFSLPSDDPLTDKIQQLSFIEIYDGDKRIELFLVVKSNESYGNGVPVIHYELLDALFLLNFSVMNEYHQLTNPTTREACQYIMDQQYLPYWQLGDVEFSRGFSYSWENQNGLLDPLFSIPNDFGEDYEFVRDTTDFPFTIHLRRPRTTVTARIREGLNLTGFEVEREGKNLVNAIVPKGNAEGVNAVDIRQLNGGIPYLMDQESMNAFYPAWYIWKDERYTIENNLLAAANSKLEAWKQPKVTWTISAVDLTKVINHPSNLKVNQNRSIKANDLNHMDVVEVQLKKYGTISLRITECGKNNVTGDPGNLELFLTNEEPGADQADYERQQEISKMTAMGAQSVIPWVFDREADYDNPVEFQFFVFDQVENVNNAFLWINTERFRATSKGNESAPTTVTAATTGGGGAYVSTVTSQSGGSSVQSSTSSSGGGTSTSTSSGGGTTQSSTSNGQSTQTSSANGSHRHVMFQTTGSVAVGTEQVLANANGVIIGLGGNTPTQTNISTHSAADNHSHSVTTPNHSHNVTTPNHTHNFSTPNHTHGVTINIPAHTHDLNLSIPNHTHNVTVTIPSHTHDLIYGIFEYNSLPNELEIWIDDNKLPTNSTSINELDLRDYMRKDSSGKITRGNHTLRIRPNDLARLEIQIMLIVFIKSRIGEKL